MVSVRRPALALAAAVAVLAGGASTSMAAPSTLTNRNALEITFECGSTTLTGVTIFQNASVALQLLDGSGRVARLITLWSYTDPGRTQGETLVFTTPGYEHNGRSLQRCDYWNALYPDTYFRATVELSPVS